MWTEKKYPLTNFWYKIFWKPKNNLLYKSRDKTYYSHGNAGWLLGTQTSVFFKDKKRKICTFIVNGDIVSVKIGKSIKRFNKKDLLITKKLSRSTYWGQGGGDVREFEYVIELKK